MPQHDYEFRSQWRVIGSPAEVLDILTDVESLPHWCPAVYSRSRLVDRGDADQVGTVVDLIVRARLGYSLSFRLTVTEVGEDRCTFTSSGDLVGWGAWQVTPDGPSTAITVDWRVRLDRPLLRRSSLLLRPIFAVNHHRAMVETERSLRLELLRRRASAAEAPSEVN